MEADAALTGQSVVDALEALSAHRTLPKAITVDHGTEFTSKALDEWAYRRGVQLDFIRPGKPVENAYIESSTVGCATSVSTCTASCRSLMPKS